MSRPRIFLPFNELLNPYGRITRLQYLAHLALYSAILLPFGIIVAVLAMGSFFEDHPIIVMANVACITLIGSFLMFCLYAKRLHDLGMPAIISVVLLVGAPGLLLTMAMRHFFLTSDRFTNFPVAIVTVIAGIAGIFGNISVGISGYLMMAPGQKGDNLYGLDPLEPL